MAKCKDEPLFDCSPEYRKGYLHGYSDASDEALEKFTAMVNRIFNNEDKNDDM